MRHLTAVSSDELIDSLHTRVITNTICSTIRSMIWWRVKIFLSWFINFGKNIRMSIIYFSLCSFLFALHLDWSFNTSVDKKIKCSFYICEIVFYFSLWLKLSIFFSLVLFSLELHNRSGKKLIGNLNVNRQFFKDVLCVTLLQEGLGQYQFLGKIATISPVSIYQHLLSNEHFYIFHLPLFITTPVPVRPPSF